MARACLLLVLVVLSVGCHRYVPAQIGDVSPGMEIRLRLSDEGAERVEEFTGLRRAEVSGELLEWSDEVLVSMPAPNQVGMNGRSLQQRVVVGADQVLGIDVREFDRTRTTLFVSGVSVVVGAALITAVAKLFGGTEKGEIPPGDNLPTDPLLLRLSH